MADNPITCPDDESGKPITPPLTEEESENERLQSAAEAVQDDIDRYEPHNSLGAAVLKQFGISPENLYSAVITIETTMVAEKVSVDVRVKPPDGSRDVFANRVQHYELVKKSEKPDGVPQSEVPYPDGIPMGDNAVKCPECGETGRRVRLDIREGKCYYCRQEEARE